MSHYWTADEDPQLRRAQMTDWLEDLGRYPAAAVASACTEWRRTQTRRPTPAELLKLCDEAKEQLARGSRPQALALPRPQHDFPSLEHLRWIKQAGRANWDGRDEAHAGAYVLGLERARGNRSNYRYPGTTEPMVAEATEFYVREGVEHFGSDADAPRDRAP